MRRRGAGRKPDAGIGCRPGRPDDAAHQGGPVGAAVEPAAEDPAARLGELRAALGRVIRGKDDRIDVLAVALLANGSVLMEDVPGVGKTTLAKAVATVVHLTFHRVQFSPDLLPTDILGSSIYSPADGTFHFRRGPVF